MKKKLFNKVFFILLYFCITVNSLAQEKSPVQQKLLAYEKILHEFQQEHDIPSISFAVLKDQELIYSNSMGFADISNKIPATDTTLYSIASLTKPIAATLILKLYEQGKIDIDGRIKDYWPGYDEYFTRLNNLFRKDYPHLMPYIEHYRYKEYDITIRQHLTHTSEGEPGKSFKYNGMLYGRLSNVVDNIVPTKFTGLMDSCILKKLNMQHSFLQYTDLKNSASIQNLARPYVHSDVDSLMEKEFPDPEELNAGAGLICSVKDLAKFDIAFDKNELISAKAKALMLTPTKGVDGITFQYGIGWFLTTYHKQSVIYHYGLQESYSGFYLKIPNKNITLIILANSADLTAGYNKDIHSTNLKEVPYIAKFLALFGQDKE